MAAGSSWGSLPSINIVEILSYLSLTDRLNITSICRRWRSCLFHPSLWRSVTFRLYRGAGAKHLADVCGSFVREATLEFQPGHHVQVRDLTRLLDVLRENTNLERLTLRPMSCSVSWQPQQTRDQWVDALEEMLNTSKGMRHLSLGCLNVLTDHSDTWLELLEQQRHTTRLQSLYLCSVKEDPDNYGLLQLPVETFAQFRSLHSLGLDYDHVTSELLVCLARRGRCAGLQKLVVHVHGVDTERMPVTNAAWRSLASANPKLQVTLNLLHSVDGASGLLDILQPAMPLAHFRSFFCQQLNLTAIDFMTRHHASTLRSVFIADCMPTAPGYYQASTDEDPFVMMAWKCPLLTHFTLMGYEMAAEDVIAIARLRGAGLETLDIPHCCISTVEEEEPGGTAGVWVTYGNVGEEFNEEVSKSLGKNWQPIPDEDLSRSLLDPYISPDPLYMPLLLQDHTQ